MKKMLQFASIVMLVMTSCQKSEDDNITVEKPKDTTSQVITKDITINFTATMTQPEITFHSLVIEVRNPNILDKYNLPIGTASEEVKSQTMSFKVENPENFQGIVEVSFVCYGYNGNNNIKKEIIVKYVDLTKESTFNLTFSKLK